jgi:hypothetical protein
MNNLIYSGTFNKNEYTPAKHGTSTISAFSNTDVVTSYLSNAYVSSLSNVTYLSINTTGLFENEYETCYVYKLLNSNYANITICPVSKEHLICRHIDTNVDYTVTFGKRSEADIFMIGNLRFYDDEIHANIHIHANIGESFANVYCAFQDEHVVVMDMLPSSAKISLDYYTINISTDTPSSNTYLEFSYNNSFGFYADFVRNEPISIGNVTLYAPITYCHTLKQLVIDPLLILANNLEYSMEEWTILISYKTNITADAHIGNVSFTCSSESFFIVSLCADSKYLVSNVNTNRCIDNLANLTIDYTLEKHTDFFEITLVEYYKGEYDASSNLNKKHVDNAVNNIFIGTNSGSKNQSGTNNLFVGHECGENNDAGKNNVFIGESAGKFNKGGNNNLFCGTQTGFNSDNGNNNVLVGHKSGFNIKGDNNIFMGYEAGLNTTIGYDNTFLGYRAGYNNTTGFQNLFIGKESGFNNTTGSRNFFIGYKAGYKNTTGKNNMIFGLYPNNENESNVSIFAPYSEQGDIFNPFKLNEVNNDIFTNNYNNTIVGINAGLRYVSEADLEGSNNTLYGASAGSDLSNVSNDNTLIGTFAGRSLQGNACTMIGSFVALYTRDANGDVFIGYNSAQCSQNVDNDIFIGHSSGMFQSNTSDNVCIGTMAGFNQKNTSNTVCIGKNAGYKQESSTHNIMVGTNTGMNSGKYSYVSDITVDESPEKNTNANTFTVLTSIGNEVSTNVFSKTSDSKSMKFTIRYDPKFVDTYTLSDSTTSQKRVIKIPNDYDKVGNLCTVTCVWNNGIFCV